MSNDPRHLRGRFRRAAVVLYFVLLAAALLYNYTFWNGWSFRISGWQTERVNLLVMVAVVALPLLFLASVGTSDLPQPIPAPRLVSAALITAAGATTLCWGASMALGELVQAPALMSDDFVMLMVMILIFLGCGILLFNWARGRERIVIIKRFAWLLAIASVLEISLAVASRVVIVLRGLDRVFQFSGHRLGGGVVAGVNVAIAALAPAIALMWLRPRYKAERAAGVPRCEVCGYDLRATPDCCPECGTRRAAG